MLKLLEARSQEKGGSYAGPMYDVQHIALHRDVRHSLKYRTRIIDILTYHILFSSRSKCIPCA